MATDTIISTIQVRTHGRYVVDLPDGDGPFPLLVGFHGYAQHAETHLRDVLRQIPGSERWIRASVQGLHSFYSRNDEVVASWMTRLHRELAIGDNIAFITAVVAQLRADFPVSDIVVFEGFSQGVAMAYRAAAAIECRGVIANGGDLAPDVAEGGAKLPPVLITRGSRDEWYSAEKLQHDVSRLQARGAAVETLEFDGGHEVPAAALEAASRFLQRLAR